jgi:hypothetical protein
MIFRTLSDRTTVTQRQRGPSLAAGRRCRQTFIFSYILERKGEAGVLALDNAHLAKGSLADDSQQPEVIQVHCLLWSAVLVLVLASLLAGVAGADRMQQGP